MPFLQGNLGKTQVHCISLKVHHGHFRGLTVFIALLLIVIVKLSDYFHIKSYSLTSSSVQRKPVYSGHPVYNGHLAISQG